VLRTVSSKDIKVARQPQKDVLRTVSSKDIKVASQPQKDVLRTVSSYKKFQMDMVTTPCIFNWYCTLKIKLCLKPGTLTEVDGQFSVLSFHRKNSVNVQTPKYCHIFIHAIY